MQAMPTADAAQPALLIRVRFPAGVYRGGDLGRSEELPSPARLHAAFVSAAAGGPTALPDGPVLIASDHERAAVSWLEENPPLGIVAPESRVTEYDAVRHRVRAAVDPKDKRDLHRDETPFEPFSALADSVVFAWPEPPPDVHHALTEIAREITHVGRADSVATVVVSQGMFAPGQPRSLSLADGRGPGREMRIPESGRWDALVAAHLEACTPARNRHASGAKGKQAKDAAVPSAGEQATRLVRFASRTPPSGWPYSEAWVIPTDPALPRWATASSNRVRSAVAVHRAIVAAIGDDVPDFVTGRDGAGPLRGHGHLSIQFVPSPDRPTPTLVIGIPPGVPEADRAMLLEALADRPTVRIGKGRFQLSEPLLRSALSFWPSAGEIFTTTVPLIVDASGRPHQGAWTLDDAVVFSVGYALRRALEADGIQWGAGWTFRRHLVEELRTRGVDARTFRIHKGASRFVHRTREGDLLVAAHAAVRLGELAQGGRGMLAIGRARHLGGGLLQPLTVS